MFSLFWSEGAGGDAIAKSRKVTYVSWTIEISRNACISHTTLDMNNTRIHFCRVYVCVCLCVYLNKSLCVSFEFNFRKTSSKYLTMCKFSAWLKLLQSRRPWTVPKNPPTWKIYGRLRSDLLKMRWLCLFFPLSLSISLAPLRSTVHADFIFIWHSIRDNKPRRPSVNSVSQC